VHFVPGIRGGRRAPPRGNSLLSRGADRHGEHVGSEALGDAALLGEPRRDLIALITSFGPATPNTMDPQRLREALDL